MIGGHRQLRLIGLYGRAFALLVIGAPVLWNRDAAALPGLALLMAAMAVGAASERASRRFSRFAPVPEAVLVGAVCGSAVGEHAVLLGGLAVPVLVGGLRRGVLGVVWGLTAGLIALAVVVVARAEAVPGEEALAILTWLILGLGLGLIGSFLHAVLRRDDHPEAYVYARALIRQLLDLSGGLDSGLDPQALAGGILSTVRDDLPTVALGLYVARDEALIPLVTSSVGRPRDLDPCEELAVEAWTQRRTVVRDHVFAFPLTTGDDTPAVVAGVLSGRLDAHRFGLDDRIRRLVRRLEPSALHLDTALLFLAFRDAATADERRRLAREMHDGVAQDIASLGYLVDALAAKPHAPEVPQRIEALRERITAVVTEVRQSVTDLRTDVGSSESLGAAISTVARNLSEVSGIPIRVTLDERPARLRPDVEAELLRIAQEAMNNAVKHSRASTIDVRCQVHAPQALISVTDNGLGLQRGRSDSHGLKIMRERAMLMNADLYIEEVPTGGLRVSVWVPGAVRHETSLDLDTLHRSVTA